MREHEKVKVNLSWKIYSSYLLVGESESCRNAFPCHTSIFLPSHFRDSWKDPVAQHPNTWAPVQQHHTKVSQVSNPTGTPLDSNLFHRFEAWSHKPPCQAPGLCSFLANSIALQVNVRQRFVDFQCFSKGLWTKPMANHVKPENLQGNLPQYSHVHYHALDINKQLKQRWWENMRKSMWTSAEKMYIISFFRLLVGYTVYLSLSI